MTCTKSNNSSFIPKQLDLKFQFRMSLLFTSSPWSISPVLFYPNKDSSNVFFRSSPLSIALSLYFLFGYLGIASLAGLAVMVVLIPVNAVLSTRLRKYQFANMKTKDKRIRFVGRLHNQDVDLRWNDRNDMYSWFEISSWYQNSY